MDELRQKKCICGLHPYILLLANAALGYKVKSADNTLQVYDIT